MDDYRIGYFLSRNMGSEVRMTPRPAKTPAWSIPPILGNSLDDPSSCSDNASDNSDKIESYCQAQTSTANHYNHNHLHSSASITTNTTNTSTGAISNAKSRKRKIIGSGGASFVTTSSTTTISAGGSGAGTTPHQHHHHGASISSHNVADNVHQHGSRDLNGVGESRSTHGSLWADAESLAADFDGSLSGLGADLSTASYDMSEALLALPSLYQNHRNQSSSHQNSSIPGFLKEEQGGLTPLSASHLHGGSSVSLPGDFHFEQSSTSPNHPNQHGVGQTSVSGNSNGTANGSTERQNRTSENDNQSSAGAESVHLDCERRFQYVLAAATSIATKVNEETLTYLNQGQPYEIKLKKLGELTAYKGTVFRSVIRLCFHDRRLQFTEKEQIYQWEYAHLNDRILQVDLPLSYGITMIQNAPHQPTNTVSFLWEPLKEVGLYVKINCISTEFTPKKHGGEKGVPFRLMIETYSHPDNVRLHAGACQVKVFKLKGADRKHKQDRDKIIKKTIGEQAKLQPSYECTVLSDISLDSLESPPVAAGPVQGQQLSPSYSTDHPVADSPEYKCNSPPSTNAIGCFSPDSVRRWLLRNRFNSCKSLWDYSGLDLLRLNKEELVEICGLAEGIRLFNALHYKVTFFLTLVNSDEPKLDTQGFGQSSSCTNSPSEQEPVFHPVCLSAHSLPELTNAIATLFGKQFPHDVFSVERLFLTVSNGASGNAKIRVVLTEQLLTTLKDQMPFKAVKRGSDVSLEALE